MDFANTCVQRQVLHIFNTRTCSTFSRNILGLPLFHSLRLPLLLTHVWTSVGRSDVADDILGVCLHCHLAACHNLLHKHRLAQPCVKSRDQRHLIFWKCIKLNRPRLDLERFYQVLNLVSWYMEDFKLSNFCNLVWDYNPIKVAHTWNIPQTIMKHICIYSIFLFIVLRKAKLKEGSWLWE